VLLAMSAIFVNLCEGYVMGLCRCVVVPLVEGQAEELDESVLFACVH
jgi:hypothetical protein